MENQPQTLESTIDLLRSYSPSVLLVRCLLLAGNRKEANKMSQQLALIESNRLSERKNESVSEVSELLLRNIFCQMLAGYRRNARILLTEFIDRVQESQQPKSEDWEGLVSKLAVGSLLADDRESARRVLNLNNQASSLMIRILQSWVEGNKPGLDECGRELSAYIERSELPVWSDTWHHLVLRIISGQLTITINEEARQNGIGAD